FFFQAEDGIRDATVTGVQTCALPISPGGCERMTAVRRADDDQPRDPLRIALGEGEPHHAAVGPADDGSERCQAEVIEKLRERLRSEERRVGKEGRSRWSRYHANKNRK